MSIIYNKNNPADCTVVRGYAEAFATIEVMLEDMADDAQTTEAAKRIHTALSIARDLIHRHLNDGCLNWKN